MTNSIHKTKAIFVLKFQTILRNPTILIGPLMAILFSFMFKIMMNPDTADPAAAAFLKTFYFSIAVIFGIVMTCIMATSLPLAEEKEKNTLRVLMTSSVTGLEFFIGSLLPVFIISVVLNIILLPINGITDINLFVYIGFTSVISLITIIIGAIIGIVADKQMTASLLATPVSLVLLLVPMMGTMNETLKFISSFIYVGSLKEVLENLVNNVPNPISLQNIIVLLVWLIGSIGIFLFAYKKNFKD